MGQDRVKTLFKNLFWSVNPEAVAKALANKKGFSQKRQRAALSFAPEERRNVATGETRGEKAPREKCPGRGDGAFAPAGANIT
jgi:hypothetical protein